MVLSAEQMAVVREDVFPFIRAFLQGQKVAAEAAMTALDTNEDARVSFREFTNWYLASDQRIEAELATIAPEAAA